MSRLKMTNLSAMSIIKPLAVKNQTEVNVIRANNAER
jgi:hypothetical protein